MAAGSKKFVEAQRARLQQTEAVEGDFRKSIKEFLESDREISKVLGNRLEQVSINISMMLADEIHMALQREQEAETT